MKQKILDALAQLSPGNADHWTGDGLPRLDVMKELVGSPVSRQQVTEAAPSFSKANAVLEGAGEESADKAQESSSEESQENNTVADNTQSQENEQGTDTPETEGVELEGDAAIEAELKEAQAEYAKAGQRLRKATEAMDVVIRKREYEEKQQRSADTISTFQQQQAAQRKAEADEKAQLAEFLKQRKAEAESK